MTKIDFIDTLRRSISPVDDYNFINETIEYYQNYIEVEVRKGRTESEVLADLGDPRLIAKSILASKGIGNSAVNEEEKDNSSNDEKILINTKSGKQLMMPLWLVKALGIATCVGVVAVAGYIVYKLLPLLAVMCIAVAAVLIFRFFKDNF